MIKYKVQKNVKPSVVELKIIKTLTFMLYAVVGLEA